MWPSDILQMSLGQLLNVSVYKVYEYKSTAALNLKIHCTGEKKKIIIINLLRGLLNIYNRKKQYRTN